MKTKFKFVSTCILTASALLGLAGCGGDSTTPTEEAPEIMIWAPSEEQQVIKAVVDEYNATATSKIKYQFTAVSEADGGTTLQSDPNVKNAPALVAAADDHMFGLVSKNIIAEIPAKWADPIKQNNTEVSVTGATVNGKVYGFPISSDNGYFLYYDKRSVTEEQAKTLESLLDTCKNAGKQFRMDLANGWYANSIPQAIGIAGVDSLRYSANADGEAIYTINWDTEIVAKATKAVSDLLNQTYKDVLLMGADEVMVSGFQNGTMIAGVSGTWMLPNLQTAIGAENVGACKLPTFTVDGTAHQMASFSGSKVYVINKYRPAAEQKQAAIVAELLTNKAAQLKRFELRKSIPCNKEALTDSAYTENANVAVKALAEQNNYAAVQAISAENRYWDQGKAIGQAIYDGILAEGQTAGTTHTVDEWKTFLTGVCDVLRKPSTGTK